MKRVLLVEWIDATNIEARLAVRDDDATHAILVFVTVDMTTGLFGAPTMWRCTEDPMGERCRILGGLGTHEEVTGQYLAGAFEAFGEAGDQEALFTYMEGVL